MKYISPYEKHIDFHHNGEPDDEEEFFG